MEIAQESEACKTGGWRVILTQVSRLGQAPRPVSHLCCRERVDGEPSRTCSVRRVTSPHCHWTGPSRSFFREIGTHWIRSCPSAHLALRIGNAYRNPAISALEVEVAGHKTKSGPMGRNTLRLLLFAPMMPAIGGLLKLLLSYTSGIRPFKCRVLYRRGKVTCPPLRRRGWCAASPQPHAAAGLLRPAPARAVRQWPGRRGLHPAGAAQPHELREADRWRCCGPHWETMTAGAIWPE